MSEDQDWRLRADVAGTGVLDRLVDRRRVRHVAQEVGTAVPHDVVITHDGKSLFAYAETQSVLNAARSAIEAVLAHDEVKAGITVSHWDDGLDEWLQIDPPLAGDAKRADEGHVRDAETEETRTIVASAGNLTRASFDQSLLEYAQRLGLQCKIIEHRHLLATQVAFTVTGPKHKIDEFAQGLKAESVATMRSEGLLALSPL